MSDSGYKQGDPVMTAAQAYLTVPQVISSSGGCSLFSLSPLVFNLMHFALKNPLGGFLFPLGLLGPRRFMASGCVSIVTLKGTPVLANSQREHNKTRDSL